MDCAIIISQDNKSIVVDVWQLLAVRLSVKRQNAIFIMTELYLPLSHSQQKIGREYYRVFNLNAAIYNKFVRSFYLIIFIYTNSLNFVLITYRSGWWPDMTGKHKNESSYRVGDKPLIYVILT